MPELVTYPAETFDDASHWCGKNALDEAGFELDDVWDFYAATRREGSATEKQEAAYDAYQEGSHSTPLFEDWQKYQLLTRSAGLFAKLVEEKRKEN